MKDRAPRDTHPHDKSIGVLFRDRRAEGTFSRARRTTRTGPLLVRGCRLRWEHARQVLAGVTRSPRRARRRRDWAGAGAARTVRAARATRAGAVLRKSLPLLRTARPRRWVPRAQEEDRLISSGPATTFLHPTFGKTLLPPTSIRRNGAVTPRNARPIPATFAAPPIRRSPPTAPTSSPPIQPPPGSSI